LAFFIQKTKKVVTFSNEKNKIVRIPAIKWWTWMVKVTRRC